MKRRNRRPQVQPKIIKFDIEHIDPLGQGVSKIDGKVTFIAGTLPGETGTATIYKRAKGVQFAQLLQLDKVAENRIESACPHFEQCPGCQFLHTDYASELEYKKATLARQLGVLGIDADAITVVPAPRRLSYRNRVQLHYRHKYIGMLDTVKNEVLEIPHCKIMREELEPAFAELQQGEWTEEHSGHGHCELYYRAGEVSVQWDQPYAHGGFSQVFDEMNLELQKRVQSQLETLATNGLLDLFAGSGNLSEIYASKGGYRALVDNFADSSTRDTPDLWVRKIKPQYVIYVSCNPASLARDLQNLSKRYRVKDIQLLDLFPATAHFETLIVLEIRKG